MNLAAADFRPHVGSDFLCGHSDVPLRLASVDQGVPQPSGSPHRDPFSVTFTGPAGLDLGQGVYVLEHAELGRLELFLVPRQPLHDGLPRLEAVFG